MRSGSFRRCGGVGCEAPLGRCDLLVLLEHLQEEREMQTGSRAKIRRKKLDPSSIQEKVAAHYDYAEASGCPHVVKIKG